MVARAKFSRLWKSSVEVAKCKIASLSLWKFASKATLRFHVAFVNLPIFRHIKSATQKSTNGSSATTICIFMSNSRGSGRHLIRLFFLFQSPACGHITCVYTRGKQLVRWILRAACLTLHGFSLIRVMCPKLGRATSWDQILQDTGLNNKVSQKAEKRRQPRRFFSYLSGARRRATRFSPGFN